MSQQAYLILENGKVFEGFSVGAMGTVIGETVFTTGMTGYLETLTDKSYYGQIITQTFPLIGNYGVISNDFEGQSVKACGYIVKQWCQDPSNFRSEGNLDTFLKKQGIVGIYGIDTRALTKILREQGTMNGMITTDAKIAENARQALSPIVDYRIIDAVENVSITEEVVINPDGKYSVVLLDFGYKANIARELIKRDCKVTILPALTSAQRIKSLKPDGIMLSNGPGDPADNPVIIENLKELITYDIPIFGICLGHQLLALANGFSREKLKYGHRGANQPAKDLISGRTYITSQNHGYAVSMDSIDEKIAQIWFVNVNDKTCEGIKYNNKPFLSVQFHPESCGGPQDTGYLFDEFMREVNSYAVK